MTASRRRLIRPSSPTTQDQERQRRIDKLRARLEKERSTLTRWLARLKRAFHAVEKAQQRIARWNINSPRLRKFMPRIIEVIVSPTGETTV